MDRNRATKFAVIIITLSIFIGSYYIVQSDYLPQNYKLEEVNSSTQEGSTITKDYKRVEGNISTKDWSTITMDGINFTMGIHASRIRSYGDIIVVDLLLQNNSPQTIRYEYSGCWLFGFEIQVVTPSGEVKRALPSSNGHVITYTCRSGVFTEEIPPGGHETRQGLFTMESIQCYNIEQGFSSSCRLEAIFNPLPPLKPIVISIHTPLDENQNLSKTIAPTFIDKEYRSFELFGYKLWRNTSTNSQLAFIIENNGNAVMNISIITIEQSQILFSDWFYLDITSISNMSKETILHYDVTGEYNDLSFVSINGNNSMTTATGPLVIDVGEIFVVYVSIPENIENLDIGSTPYIMIGNSDYISVVTIEIEEP